MHMVDQYLRPFLVAQFGSAGGSVPLPHHRLCPLYQQGFNGGYFWNRALLVRPAHRVEGVPLAIEEWNTPALWTGRYQGICRDVVFFAEDAFGLQFGLKEERIVQFDPETALFTDVAATIDGWCQELVRDSSFYTGAPVLAAWEQKNGLLKTGFRLLPQKLFMLGGEFHSDNMVCKPDIEGLLVRAQLWEITKDLPDGQKIIFRTDAPGQRPAPPSGQQ